MHHFTRDLTAMFETREKVNPAPAHDAFTQKEGRLEKNSCDARRTTHRHQNACYYENTAAIPTFLLFKHTKNDKNIFFHLL